MQCASVTFDRVKRGVETEERPSDPGMHEDVRSVYRARYVRPTDPGEQPFSSVVNLLALPQLSDSCVPHLVDFLAHKYPTVRCLLLCS